jgi:hypothetical protein
MARASDCGGMTDASGSARLRRNSLPSSNRTSGAPLAVRGAMPVACPRPLPRITSSRATGTPAPSGRNSASVTVPCRPKMNIEGNAAWCAPRCLSTSALSSFQSHAMSLRHFRLAAMSATLHPDTAPMRHLVAMAQSDGRALDLVWPMGDAAGERQRVDAAFMKQEGRGPAASARVAIDDVLPIRIKHEHAFVSEGVQGHR